MLDNNIWTGTYQNSENCRNRRRIFEKQNFETGEEWRKENSEQEQEREQWGSRVKNKTRNRSNS